MALLELTAKRWSLKLGLNLLLNVVATGVVRAAVAAAIPSDNNIFTEGLPFLKLIGVNAAEDGEEF